MRCSRTISPNSCVNGACASCSTVCRATPRLAPARSAAPSAVRASGNWASRRASLVRRARASRILGSTNVAIPAKMARTKLPSSSHPANPTPAASRISGGQRRRASTKTNRSRKLDAASSVNSKRCCKSAWDAMRCPTQVATATDRPAPMLASSAIKGQTIPKSKPEPPAPRCPEMTPVSRIRETSLSRRQSKQEAEVVPCRIQAQ